MALSGSLTAGYWYADNGQSRGYTLNWSATQSIANNQSTITWWVDTAGSYPYTVAERTLTVTLAGQTLINKTDRVMRGAGRVASGSFNVTHDSAGNKSISASITAAVYTSAVNMSNSGSWSLNTIPRQANISTAPNFNDEANPTITYSNPAGNSVTSLDACISLTGSKDDVPYRAITKTGTSYTFNLTEAERATLRNACTTANSREVIFYVRTVIGGNTYHSTLKKTLTIVNATPTFTSSVKDTGGASVPLTNNNQVMIKGFNYMNVSMEATAYKGATIKSYKITNGSSIINAASGGFNNSESNVFKFEVWDSRGNTNSYTTTLDMIDYIPLTCNVDGKIILSVADSTKANVIFTVQGNYFDGSFGAVANSLSLDYTVSDEEGNTIATDAIEAALNDNTYSIEVNIDDLDYRKSYVVYVAAADAIKSITAQSKTLKATPIFDWGEEDFNFNVPITIQGKSLVDLIYPVGSIYMSVNYFEPSTIFGGEWERLMDKFLLGSGAVYASGQEGGKSSVTLSAAIGATNSSTNALGYIAGGYTSYQAANAPTYTVYGASSANGGSWNHATPVTEHSSTSRDVSIMPPYLTVNMWKRVA